MSKFFNLIDAYIGTLRLFAYFCTLEILLLTYLNSASQLKNTKQQATYRTLLTIKTRATMLGSTAYRKYLLSEVASLNISKVEDAILD